MEEPVDPNPNEADEIPIDTEAMVGKVPECGQCKELRSLVQGLEQSYHDLLFQRVFESSQKSSDNEVASNVDLALILPAIQTLQAALEPLNDKASSWEDVVRIVNRASSTIQNNHTGMNALQDQGTETDIEHVAADIRASPYMHNRMDIEDGSDDDDIMASQTENNWINNYRDTSRQDLVTADLNEQYEAVMNHVGHLSEAFVSWKDQFMKLQKQQMSGLTDIENIEAFEELCENVEQMLVGMSTVYNINIPNTEHGKAIYNMSLNLFKRLKSLVNSLFGESQSLVRQNEYLTEQFERAITVKKRLIDALGQLSELKQSVSDKDHAINFYSNELENAKLILNQNESHIQALNTVINDKAAKVQELDAEVVLLKSKINEYQLKMSRIESKALEVDEQKNLLQKELSETLERLTGELTTVELEKTDLEDEVQRLTSQNEETKHAYEKLESESKIAQSELKKTNEDLIQANTRIAEHEERFSRVKLIFETRASEIKSLSEKVAELEQINICLRSQAQLNLAQNTRALQEQLNFSTEKIKSLEELLLQKVKQVNDLKLQYDESQKRMSEIANAEIGKFKIQLNNASNIINSMKSQLDTQVAAENILKTQFTEKCKEYENRIKHLEQQIETSKKSEQLSQTQITELNKEYIEEIEELKKQLLEFSGDMKLLKSELEEKSATEHGFKEQLHQLQTVKENEATEFEKKYQILQEEASSLKTSIQTKDEELENLKSALAEKEEAQVARLSSSSRLPIPKRPREEFIDLIEVKKISRTVSQTFQDLSAVDTERENLSQISNGRRSSRRVGQVIVSFSGFRDDQPNYNTKLKHELAEQLRSLGAVVKMDGEFEDKITHVITPPGCRTLKSFAASLTSKWLITNTAWVTESFKSGKFVGESQYGERFTERPFKDKSFFLAESFMKECRNGKEFRVDNAKNLITVLGGGQIVKSVNAADNVIRGGSDSSNFPSKNVYTWSEFLELIPVSKK